MVAGVNDGGVGVPVPVIEYVIVPLGAVQKAVNAVVVADPPAVGTPGALGTVNTVPLVPEPVDVGVPAVPVPPAPLYAVTVSGPYPVFGLSPEKPALVPVTMFGASGGGPVTTYDPAPPTGAVQLSVNPDVDTLVTLSAVGVPRTVVTAAIWGDGSDEPPVLFALRVNGPYVVPPDKPLSVYDVLAAVPENVTDPVGMFAPMSVYDVIVPPGEDHVNGIVAPTGVPAARFDGALGAVNAWIEAVVLPSDGPPEIPTFVRDWSVNVYAEPGVARLDTVYPVDAPATGVRVVGPPTRM